ncbi:MAG: hypothetical protein QXI02_04060 [Candidatus Caldarchaeum sp.]
MLKHKKFKAFLSIEGAKPAPLYGSEKELLDLAHEVLELFDPKVVTLKILKGDDVVTHTWRRKSNGDQDN